MPNLTANDPLAWLEHNRLADHLHLLVDDARYAREARWRSAGSHPPAGEGRGQQGAADIGVSDHEGVCQPYLGYIADRVLPQHELLVAPGAHSPGERHFISPRLRASCEPGRLQRLASTARATRARSGSAGPLVGCS